jgi:hypothetical protein
MNGEGLRFVVFAPSAPIRGEHRDTVVRKMTDQVPHVLLHSAEPRREVVGDHEHSRNVQGRGRVRLLQGRGRVRHAAYRCSTSVG